MKIGIIGPGRLGWRRAKAIKEAGDEIIMTAAEKKIKTQSFFLKVLVVKLLIIGKIPAGASFILPPLHFCDKIFLWKLIVIFHRKFPVLRGGWRLDVRNF